MAKTARIEFRTDEVFIKSLEELATRTNRSRAEVIRDAMNLYIRAVDEWEKNGRGIVFQSMDEKTAIAITTVEEPCFA